jgi:DNA-directed RNA polymerase subunit RPC12/RpoP
MLVNCKPGCKGKKITTNASLDLEQDEAVCTACSEIIPVSKFVKMTMKHQGDVIKNDNRKSFQFSCLTCKKKVQTKLEGSKPKGINCSGDCQFNISKFILIAMQNVSQVKVDEPETSQGSELE